MKSYTITKTRDGYCNAGIKEMKEILKQDLNISEAYKKLLNIFNSFAEDEGKYFPNWGLAASWPGHCTLRAQKTHYDGTRSFRYDVWTYEIKEEK